jgi:hypothetical protein
MASRRISSALLVTLAEIAALMVFARYPRSSSAQQVKCLDTWNVSSSAQETWAQSNWTAPFSLYAPANSQAVFLTDSGASETEANKSPVTIAMNISLASNTSAGEGAGVVLIDVNTLGNWLTNNGEETLWINLLIDCSTGQSAPPCQADLQQLYPVLDNNSGAILKLAVWYDGCWHASDNQSKTFKGLNGSFGYALAAISKSSSAASIAGNISYSANPAVQRTSTIYGPPQGGNMLPPGQYTHRFVGKVTPVSPQHNGTVSGTTFVIFAPMAKGTFAIDSSDNVSFTGTVSPSNCPVPQLPQHLIPKLQSPASR